MPTFLIHFAISDASPEDRKALQTAMEEAGFSRTVSGSNNLRYHLPETVYHFNGPLTKDQLLDSAKRIALRTGRRNSIIITESGDSAWVGLELAGRDFPGGKARQAESPASVFAPIASNLTSAPSPRSTIPSQL